MGLVWKELPTGPGTVFLISIVAELTTSGCRNVAKTNAQLHTSVAKFFGGFMYGTRVDL